VERQREVLEDRLHAQAEGLGDGEALAVEGLDQAGPPRA
jgi:hypothetical protein